MTDERCTRCGGPTESEPIAVHTLGEAQPTDFVPGRPRCVRRCEDPVAAIVRDLAAVTDYDVMDGEYGWCRVCQEWPHDQSCPLRRAREWTETHP